MNSRVVLDASAAMRLVLRQQHAAELLGLLESSSAVLAPALFHSEAANSLWKYRCHKALEIDEALAKYEQSAALIDAFTPDQELALEALAAAAHYEHPVYDLLYAVLARRTGSQVATFDKRLKSLLRRMEIPYWTPGADEGGEKVIRSEEGH